MEQNNKNRSGIRQLLAALLVMALCCALIMPAAAEEAPAELTADTMSAAWASLSRELNPEQEALYGTTITTLNTTLAVNESLYIAINETVECLDTEKDLRNRAEALKLQIGNSSFLTQEQQAQLQDALDAHMAANAIPVVDHLMNAAQNMIADGNYILSAEEQTNYLETLGETEALLTNVEALLQAAEQLSAVDAQLQVLQTALATGTAAPSATRDALQISVDEFVRIRGELDVSIGAYVTLTEQEQTDLLQQIRQLVADVEAFPSVTLVNVVAELDALNADVSKANEGLEQMGGQLMFGYIALAVAAIGVLMAIAVAVFSIGKSRGEKVDLSVMASREDVEAVDRQNKILKQQLDQMDLRMEHTAKMLEEYRANAESALAAVSIAPVPDPEPISVPKETPVTETPEEEYLGSTEKAGNLRMKYQFMNPASSYLQPDPAGTIVLFADNTVELAAMEMQMTNELKGWINNGLFVMFDVEVAGKLVDIENDKLPSGYFSIAKLVSRPRVRQSGKSYLVERKGYIKMQ